MKSLTEQLSNYAAYHRDARNIATHFVGIPLIILAIAALLSRPSVNVGGVMVTPALVIAGASAVYYLRLDRPLGLLMAALFAGAVAFGHGSAAQETEVWLAIGVGGFVAGWIIQFVGHWFEGRKPAFVDDLIGLIIGPLFVVVEVLFKCGVLHGLQQEIEQRVGPVHNGASRRTA
ncbi:MAG: DUF962 domain-containing protein [Defluviicoccus sp.]|nr:DUF962 domain-containing protein [Defluviicoccus sp.]